MNTKAALQSTGAVKPGKSIIVTPVSFSDVRTFASESNAAASQFGLRLATINDIAMLYRHDPDLMHELHERGPVWIKDMDIRGPGPQKITETGRLILVTSHVADSLPLQEKGYVYSGTGPAAVDASNTWGLSLQAIHSQSVKLPLALVPINPNFKKVIRK